MMMDDSDLNSIPDRQTIRTEQFHPSSNHLHLKSIGEILDCIHQRDREVIEALNQALPQIETFIQDAEKGFIEGGRLVYFGAGTSGRLGVLDASEAPPTFQVSPDRVVGIIAGGDPALRKSSEGKEDDPEGVIKELSELKLNSHDSVIGIAAGGTTPYVIGGLKYLSENHPKTQSAFLHCSPVNQKLIAKHSILLDTGPEILTGSTRMKAGTATKLALNMISTTLMIRAGKVYDNLMVDMKASNQKLMDRAARILSHLTGLERMESFKQLQLADGDLKAAIVMKKKGCGLSEAKTQLSRVSNRLDQVL